MTSSRPERPDVPSRSPSSAVVIAGIVALSMIGLAAVMFVTTDSGGTERLALLFAVLAPTVATLVSMYRSDQSAAALNGTFDDRVVSAVYRAQRVRRVTDPTIPSPDETLDPRDELVP